MFVSRVPKRGRASSAPSRAGGQQTSTLLPPSDDETTNRLNENETRTQEVVTKTHRVQFEDTGLNPENKQLSIILAEMKLILYYLAETIKSLKNN